MQTYKVIDTKCVFFVCFIILTNTEYRHYGFALVVDLSGVCLGVSGCVCVFIWGVKHLQNVSSVSNVYNLVQLSLAVFIVLIFSIRLYFRNSYVVMWLFILYISNIHFKNTKKY